MPSVSGHIRKRDGNILPAHPPTQATAGASGRRSRLEISWKRPGATGRKTRASRGNGDKRRTRMAAAVWLLAEATYNASSHLSRRRSRVRVPSLPLLSKPFGGSRTSFEDVSRKRFASGRRLAGPAEAFCSSEITLAHAYVSSPRLVGGLQQLLGLEKCERVSVGVLEPSRLADARRCGNVIDGLERRKVVVLKHSAAAL